MPQVRVHYERRQGCAAWGNGPSVVTTAANSAALDLVVVVTVKAYQRM